MIIGVYSCNCGVTDYYDRLLYCGYRVYIVQLLILLANSVAIALT